MASLYAFTDEELLTAQKVNDYLAQPSAVPTGATVYDTGWVGLTFATGYTDYSASYPCQIRRVGLRVTLRGLAKPTSGSWSSGESIVASLPSAFIPPQYFYAAAATSAVGSPGRIIVKDAGSSGEVAIARSGTVTYVSIDASWLMN